MPLKLVTFKIEERLLKRLDDYAARHNMTRSEAIRRAIAYFLAVQQENESKTPKIIRIQS